jgi:hypothetical protein
MSIYETVELHFFKPFRDSIVASISPCHGDDPGSIPGHGAFFAFFLLFSQTSGNAVEYGYLLRFVQVQAHTHIYF